MSYGWSAGDLALFAKIAHDIYGYYQSAPQNLRQSLEKFQSVAKHLKELSDVLKKSGWPGYDKAPKLKEDLEEAKRFFDRYTSLSAATTVSTSRLFNTARLGLGPDRNKLHSIDKNLKDHLEKMDAFKQHVILICSMRNLELAQRLLVQAHSPSTTTDSSGLQSIDGDKQCDISVVSGLSNRLSTPRLDADNVSVISNAFSAISLASKLKKSSSTTSVDREARRFQPSLEPVLATSPILDALEAIDAFIDEIVGLSEELQLYSQNRSLPQSPQLAQITFTATKLCDSLQPQHYGRSTSPRFNLPEIESPIESLKESIFSTLSKYSNDTSITKRSPTQPGPMEISHGFADKATTMVNEDSHPANAEELQPKSGDSPEDFGQLQIKNTRADVSHAEHTTALNADNFTDSGYSTASNNSKVDVLFVAEEIAIFLLDNAMVRSLIGRALRLENRIEAVAGRLRPLIRRYGRNLEGAAHEALHFNIAQELMRHAPYVARALVSLHQREALGKDRVDNHLLEREQRVEFLLQTRRDLDDQARRGTISETDQMAARSRLDDLDEDDTAPLLQISIPTLEEARCFMATAEALHSFLANLTRMVYADPMSATSYEVERGLGLSRQWRSDKEPGAFGGTTAAHEVTFNVNWTLSEYVHEEFDMLRGSHPDLRALLVLSGEPDCCYASTCEAYMRRYWPTTCDDVFRAVGFNVAKDGSRIRSTRDIHHPESGAITGLHIVVQGTPEEIIEIAQQLSWLSATIRVPRKNEVSLSESLLQSTHGNEFTISQLPLQYVENNSSRCWLPLFRGTVLARGYPTPLRGEEKGIELPFHLLLSVAGTLYPSWHHGGIVLQGFSRLLVPVQVYKTTGNTIPGAQASIQWHLKTSGGDRSRFDTTAYLETHKWAKISDPGQLAAARTFLGSSPSVVVNLGTDKTVQYHKEIRFSGADEESHRPSIQGPSSVNLGTSGLGIFGVNVTAPIIWGKALAHNISGDHDNYLEILDASAERPIILYDTGVATAYMAQTSCVLLHMLHTWAANMSDCRDDIPYIEPTWDAGQAARKKLKEHPDFAMRRDVDPVSEKQKMVKDLVLQFWESLNQKSWELLQHRSESQTPQAGTGSQKLYGWEYMDIIWNNAARRKQIWFNENWIRLADTVTVLLGKNFGDVVTPAPGTRLCSAWDPIPSHRQYLVATIDCLRTLAWKKGSRRDMLSNPQLTDNCWWYPNSTNLFSDCRECLSDPKKRCEKLLQSLTSASQDGSQYLLPPTEGAIVFGYRKLRKDFPHTNEAQQPVRPVSASVHRPRLPGQVWERAVSPLRRLIVTMPVSTDRLQSLMDTELNDMSATEDRQTPVAGAAR